MRTRLLLLGTALASLAGCATPLPGPTATSPAAPSTSVPSASAPSASPSLGSAEPAVTPTDYKVTFGFAVPSGVVEVPHPFTPPPLRTLVGVFVGDHPEGAPAYQRMSFYFRGGYPSYRVSYVPQIVGDASGILIPVAGNAFLRVVFTSAQAHTSSGSSSVTSTPPATIGFTNLKAYAPAGDYEGYVSYGLGLQTKPNSDQVLLLRLGELTKSDGSGGTYYVVFVDIQTA